MKDDAKTLWKFKVENAIKQFAALTVVFLFTIILLRIFEFIYSSNLHGLPTDFIKVAGYSFLSDIIFWLKASWWLLFIFVPLYLLSGRAAFIVYVISIVIICILYLGLIQYFNQALVPLGADLYGYSLADIKQTTGAGGGVNSTILIAIFVIASLLVFLLLWFRKKLILNRYAAYGVVICISVFMFFSPASSVNIRGFKSEFSGNLALNKADHFLSQSFNHFFPKQVEVDIYADNYIGDFGDGTMRTQTFTYVDEDQYPFLRYDSTQDVLSPFLNKSATPPNIVIILVEGLGRAFSNNAAYLGSFTPFLDSLSQKSLYWENCLSGGGRTFAALPTVLGSLPFAKNGFSELNEKMPPHLSLLSLMKLNGYQTSFYYGGNASFDKMNTFLMKSNIDNIYEEKTFPAGYTKMPTRNGFSWGYPDNDLFKFYLNTKVETSTKPTLSVLLTVSMHSPFLLTEQKQYWQKFEDRMNSIGIDEGKKESYRNYKDQYASILYTDDALRNLFNSYKSRSDFNNTIFIITGDHRMPEIPMVSKIDRYHVPFMIYSPLLNRTSKFSAVASHFDIAPSLIAFMKANYNFQSPSLVSWIGSGLDTTRSQQNVHAYPLMQTKNDLVDFILEDNLVNNENLFQMGQNLTLNAINDEKKLAQAKVAFNQFKAKNTKIADGFKLIPDSIYQRYFPR